MTPSPDLVEEVASGNGFNAGYDAGYNAALEYCSKILNERAEWNEARSIDERRSGHPDYAERLEWLVGSLRVAAAWVRASSL